MAAPSYATDLNDIWIDGGGTAWTLISSGGGGANSQTDPETDDYIQGSSAWSRNPFSSSIRGGVVASTETVASGDAVYFWLKADAIAALATHAAGGMQALIGTDSSNIDCFYVRGSDDYAYGGWVCVPVDPTLTPSTVIGSGASSTAVFGCRWNVPSSGPSKGFPFKVDAMRHGRQHEVTAGDSGTPATWDLLAAWDVGTSNANQYGIVQPTNTGAALQGIVYWGTASTSVYSRDSNRTIAIIDTEWTATDFTQIVFAHASNDVVWDNVGLIALGTNNRGIIDVTANGTVSWTNSVFSDIDVTNLGGTGSTFDGCKWISCNEIDANGGSLVGAEILTPTVATDSYGVLWNVATDPDTYLDGTTFEMGTNSHHAIEFGTSAPTTMTLRNVTFTGFNETTDEQNNSTLNFLRTSGSTTVNIEGTGTAAANITYKTTGTHTVTIVGSVTLTLQNTVSGSQCGIYAVDDDSELMNETSTGADVTEAYTGSTPRNVIIRVRKASSDPKYKPYIASGQIVSGTGLTVSVDQIEDTVIE